MRVGQTSFIFFLSKIGSSLLSFVAMVYFARLLGSETLGVYFLVLAVVSWLFLIGTLGVKKAVMKRISEGEDQSEYFTAGLLLQLLFLSLVVGGILGFRPYLESYIGAPVIEFLILILIANTAFSFIGMVLKGVHQVHTYAALDILSNGGRSLLQVGAVMFGFGLAGMLAGHAVGTGILVIAGLVIIPVSFHRPKKHHFVSLISYAKFAWLGGFQGKTFSWMDTIVLGFFVSAGLIGVYEIAWNIASFMAIFSVAISQTLFPEISDASSDERLQEVSSYLQDGVTYCGLFLIPGLFGSLLLGEQILRIYGEEFTRGVYVLTLLILARLIYSYQRQFTTTLDSIDRPDLAFRINATFITSNILLNIVLIWLYGWIGAAVATVCSAVIGLSVGFWYVRLHVPFDVPVIEISKQWIAAAVMAFGVGGLIRALELVHQPITIPVAIVLVGFGAGIFFAALIGLSEDFRTTMANNIPLGTT